VWREGVGHVYASGAFPVVRRDHSLGFAMVWGVAQHLNGKKLGIIHHRGREAEKVAALISNTQAPSFKSPND